MIFVVCDVSMTTALLVVPVILEGNCTTVLFDMLYMHILGLMNFMAIESQNTKSGQMNLCKNG